MHALRDAARNILKRAPGRNRFTISATSCVCSRFRSRAPVSRPYLSPRLCDTVGCSSHRPRWRPRLPLRPRDANCGALPIVAAPQSEFVLAGQRTPCSNHVFEQGSNLGNGLPHKKQVVREREVACGASHPHNLPLSRDGLPLFWPAMGAECPPSPHPRSSSRERATPPPCLHPLWMGIALPRIGNHPGYISCLVTTFRTSMAASAPTRAFRACQSPSCLVDPNAPLRSTLSAQTSSPHSLHLSFTTLMVSK